MAGPGARAPLTLPGHPDAFEDWDQLRCVSPLARSDEECKGLAPALTGEMDLAGQSAPGPSESLVGAVLPGR
ncbi:hypothetical protein GCM10010503_39040 [Streptomyces lucensis JCM 4490]|uniref:Uncharacterized protein n=1 Tax=Streptomyces lucensis JCM 4490 TaxID=1306176 RepID=A0A918MSY7_9ACTN|nr:hypothetical protein GCM10010503_39040 [Streptomyces lucensis JCM 4490]